MLNKSIKFLIENKLVAFLAVLLLLLWGAVNAPFDLSMGLLPRNPVAVDAIPDIGDNQQIVYTEWEGQSPQAIEDQITYPLTSRLLSVPGVKTVRGSSMFGFSSLYIIFEEDVDFYWSRSRLLESLSSLPKDLLPDGVSPTLGPDATALGQIFWYTLEGRDESGKVTGGWDLHEIRRSQDFYVKNALSAANGVSEVASIGGYVQEYQIDVNPELLRQYNISLSQIVKAVKQSNKDVGAKTLEINQAEYFVRGLGYVKSIEDIENATVSVTDFTPIRIKDLAIVSLGPDTRRGILDKEGAEVVGGVVTARYGANPLETIENLQEKIAELQAAMPQKTLKDGRRSRLTIVPFYDRSELIRETIGTLGTALSNEVLITILVVLVLLFNLRISVLVSSLIPIAVMVVFIAMKIFKVDANIVALSGIAIAIGTLVDMGIILSENIVRHLDLNPEYKNINELVYTATTEVSGAILTAGLTTVISFIPVFMLTGAEGKLFTPLAFTKTVALLASMLIALFLVPPVAALLLRKVKQRKSINTIINGVLFLLGILIIYKGNYFGLLLIGFACIAFLAVFNGIAYRTKKRLQLVWCLISIVVLLGYYWRPLGFENHFLVNLIFVALVCALVLGVLYAFHKQYERILIWALENKALFLSIPIALVLLGSSAIFGLGKEFMPSLDEGSYLLMPTAMPHAGVSENRRILAQLDMAVASLPEVETVVGKAGRVNSPLDPAPMSMFENMILYKSEYILDAAGMPVRFKTNSEGLFETKNGTAISSGTKIDKRDLVIDSGGEFYRNWRPEIKNKEDIWKAISKVTQLPGITSAPKLQPIETRLLMLQTGMRAAMGIKIKGQSLEQIEAFGLQIENTLKTVEGVDPKTVFADRIVSKPYLLLDIDRNKIGRYGISIEEVQELIQVAVGGKVLSKTIEGRERFGVRVRYPRELRSSPEDISQIYMQTKDGISVPLSELVQIRYEKGPQQIKSEDSFVVGHVLFDKAKGFAENEVVTNAQKALEDALDSGAIAIPEGLSYVFSGTYENELRAEKTLSLVIPLILLAIFIILYLQFKSVSVSLMVFSGVLVAFAGGFILLWLYGQPWFMNFGLGEINFRSLFNMKTVNLSVAIWVGFIALFGIATDDGVVMATYLKQSFDKEIPNDVKKIRAAVLEAGRKRIRPCLMTTATTILALLPILTVSGRGSDIMIPMAIPSMGGMLVALITLLVVPVLFSWKKENELKTQISK